MSRARIHLAGAVLRLVATLALVTGPAAAQDALHFPKPDRPVARIIAPSYSTEEKRDRHGEAERVMDRLGIKPGMRVADVEPRYLRGLMKRLEREGIRGVTAVQGTPGDPKLPPNAVDLAILSHVYHE